MFLIQGDSPQFLNWEEYGLKITVPQDILAPMETSEVSVAALVGGQFLFPTGTDLISAVYAISVSKPLLKPIKLEVHHCAHLITQDHANYLSFATVSVKPLALPYQFQLEKGGQFYLGNQYGSICLPHFCLKTIVKSLMGPFWSDDMLAETNALDHSQSGEFANLSRSTSDDETAFVDEYSSLELHTEPCYIPNEMEPGENDNYECIHSESSSDEDADFVDALTALEPITKCIHDNLLITPVEARYLDFWILYATF